MFHKNWGSENFFGIFESKKHGSKTNLVKKVYEKNGGSNNFFASSKAHIELTPTLGLIKVWHWRPKSCLDL